MMEGYDVAAVYCDPWKWQDELVEWDGWPSKIVELQTNSNRRMPEVVDRFRSALEEGSVTTRAIPTYAGTLSMHAFGRWARRGRARGLLA